MKLKINEYDLSFINDFIGKVDSLIQFPKNRMYKKLEEIKEIINEFKKYKDNKKIRLLFIGKISSEKTSLLNSIIGNNLNILDSSMLECTKFNFIIKNSNDIDHISLKENLLIKNKYGDYFKEKNNIPFTDYKDLINKIKEYNKDNNMNKYYTITVPIETFKIKKYVEDFEIIKINFSF